MKLLGIDPGEKYFGLAIGELEFKTAFPYKVLKLDKIEDFIKELENILEKEKIQKVIIGRPLNFSGRETKQTKNIDVIMEIIKEKIKIPMENFDERLTSKMADKLSSNKKNNHAVAASIILQDYFDREYL